MRDEEIKTSTTEFCYRREELGSPDANVAELDLIKFGERGGHCVGYAIQRESLVNLVSGDSAETGIPARYRAASVALDERSAADQAGKAGNTCIGAVGGTGISGLNN